jgi:hypothetical protein
MYDSCLDGVDAYEIGEVWHIYGGKYRGADGKVISLTRCKAWMEIIPSGGEEEDSPLFQPCPKLVHICRRSLLPRSARKKELLEKGNRVHLLRKYAGYHASIIRMTPKMVVVKLNYYVGEVQVLKTSVTVMTEDDKHYPVPTGQPRRFKFVYPIHQVDRKYVTEEVFYNCHVPRVNHLPPKYNGPYYDCPNLVEDLIIER